MNITLEIESIDIPAEELNAKLQNNRGLWTYAAEKWRELYKPYVPFREGILYGSVAITPKQIEHTAPYAHYQYTGVVYGPNIPIREHGRVVGWYSPISPKHSTGRELQHYRGQHLKASKEWDKAAEPTQKPKLIRQIQAYIDEGRLNLND